MTMCGDYWLALVLLLVRFTHARTAVAIFHLSPSARTTMQRLVQFSISFLNFVLELF